MTTGSTARTVPDPEVIRVDALLKEATGEVIRRIAVNTTAELIERTPVDIGWARANWVPAIGSPALAAVGNLDRESRAAQLSAARARQAAGQASLFGYELDDGNVFISNGVPYIGRLNGGSSDQAPEGFVQDAIAAGIRSVGRGVIG